MAGLMDEGGAGEVALKQRGSELPVDCLVFQKMVRVGRWAGPLDSIQ